MCPVGCISAEGEDSPNECPKHSNGETPVMLEHFGMRGNPILPSLFGPLWPWVVASDWVLFMGQIELNSILVLNLIVWNRTIYMYKNGFGTRYGWYAIKPNQTKQTVRPPTSHHENYRRKWTRRHEFKSWTRLISFHIALIPLGKVWIQLFSLQLWVNSRRD